MGSSSWSNEMHDKQSSDVYNFRNRSEVKNQKDSMTNQVLHSLQVKLKTDLPKESFLLHSSTENW